MQRAMQAAQVRKVSFVPDDQLVASGMYDPETHHSCTVHAGTYVQQVWPPLACTSLWHVRNEVMSGMSGQGARAADARTIHASLCLCSEFPRCHGHGCCCTCVPIKLAGAHSDEHHAVMHCHILCAVHWSAIPGTQVFMLSVYAGPPS